MAPVPFRALGHFVVAPVRLGDIEAECIIDSGIGVNVISNAVADALGCERTGATHTGRRMSGQAVEVELARLPSLELDGHRWEDIDVAVLDIGGAAGTPGISGFLALSLFGGAGITIDYASSTVTVEDSGSLEVRARDGVAVPVDVERDGPSTVVYVSLDVPGIHASLRAEVDMGSDCLILDTRFAGPLGIELDDDRVQKRTGTDETGHTYARYFTSLGGAVRLTDAPTLSQPAPDVMFQTIIHDALVGTAFLRRYAVTFDLLHERLALGPHSQ